MRHWSSVVRRRHGIQNLLLAGLIWLWAIAAVAGQQILPPAPEGSFSIVVIPDTQQYLGRGTKMQPKSDAEVTNPVFAGHVQWILDHLEEQRIVLVSHVGDIVDRKQPEQWAVAQRCMDRLHGRVPYGIAPGNHDIGTGGSTAMFQQYFPASRFAGMSWYGGTFSAGPDPAVSANNADSFQRFSAAGLNFVFLHLECNAPDDVLQWADQVLQTNADRRALVTTHMGLGPLDRPKTEDEFRSVPKGRMRWKKCHGDRGNTPQQMWDKCFRKHANLFLVFSGDQSRTQAMRLQSRNDAGGPVYELLSDYGGAWLRVCRFVPRQNRIEVWTVDSRKGTVCEGTDRVPDPAQHRFDLDYDMGGPQAR